MSPPSTHANIERCESLIDIPYASSDCSLVPEQPARPEACCVNAIKCPVFASFVSCQIASLTLLGFARCEILIARRAKMHSFVPYFGHVFFASPTTPLYCDLHLFYSTLTYEALLARDKATYMWRCVK